MSVNSKLEAWKALVKGKKAAVIGVGISNRPLIKWLHGLGCVVTAFDKLGEDDPSIVNTKAEFAAEGVTINWSLGEGYMDALSNECFDFVFKTPKMRMDMPEIVAAKDKGAVLLTEMELFIALCPCEIFGITGSDGKTTTTTVVSEILKQAGYKVWIGGNIGTPLLDKVGEMTPSDKVVLELSSFQLLYMSRSVSTAIVTNITPNHLDFHKDYDEYISSKTNMFKYQDALGKVVLNGACDITYNMKDIAPGRVSFFAQDRANTVRNGESPLIGRAYLDGSVLTYEYNGEKTAIIDEKDIFIPGKHNVENYLAAISAVWDYVTVDDIRTVAKEFTGVQHRIEFIRELDGVQYYNSSIDTSPNRTMNTMRALESRGRKGVLIAGGADKKCVYDGLGDAILAVCDRIVLYGSNACFVKDILAKEANGREYTLVELESRDGDVYEFPETREAVRSKFVEAIDEARKMAKPGELVILSSIGTSYDHFRHFEHRGDMFKELVNELE
ncbi:MAG: UDP-N-acetylmuramoyl-L-alanine--D-glutamate ligase [Saccharofermentans sp.]|nr:UDP-N-acetylmuramoyl-L-alanine--D-glutamate ligase [Saccharofermentans sp.]